MTMYGYARVSAADQNLDTQIEQLKEYGCEEIFQEKITGVAERKPVFERLLSVVQPGDSIVVTRIDRLGRDTLQMLTLIEDLNKRGVRLEIMNLPFDANNSMGKALMQVAMVFAQLERDMTKEKQRAGIELAKRRGVYRGRPHTYTKRHKGLQHALELFNNRDQNGMTVDQISEITGISRATIYRAARQQKSEKPD
jgi:DNA invertase Pin-like site-specific DNA recombinase